MPKFRVVPLHQAMLASVTGKQAELINEYTGYLEQLGEGLAGELQADKDETLRAVRRRLTKAAKLSGKRIVSKRSGESVHFWLVPNKDDKPKRGRGRPKKATKSSTR